MSAKFPPKVPKVVIEAAKSKAPIFTLITYLIIASVIIGLYCLLNPEPEAVILTSTSTPAPTSNIEFRVQQIELQLIEVKEKQQELQQGVEKVENQYKSWVKPFENLFSASQKEYIERYHKKYAEVG